MQSINGACSECWKNIYALTCDKCGRTMLLESERKALEFSRAHKGWNTYHTDKETIAIMRNLEMRGEVMDGATLAKILIWLLK